MKKILLLIIIIQISILTKAQRINLGKDTTFCTSSESGIGIPYVGKNLKINGDTTGFKFLWSCTFIGITNNTYTGVDFLNNVTIPNPYMISSLMEDRWLKLVLTATKDDSVFKDSINVRFSRFAYTDSYREVSLAKGDSISLSETSTGGGIHPWKFLKWEPTTALTNPDSFPTYCKNTSNITVTSIYYKSFFEDSVGCEVSDYFYTINFLDTVTGVSFFETESSIKKEQNRLLITVQSVEIKDYLVTDLSGKEIDKGKSLKPHLIEFDLPKLPNGLLIFQITSVKNKVITLKYFNNEN